MPDEPSGLPPPPDWNAAQPVIPSQPPGFPPQPGFPQQAAPYGYYPQPQAYAAGQPGNGIGIAGGVCGIVAVVLCWIPFVDYVSIVLGALAIIFGALGVRNANAHGGAGKGMAITGIRHSRIAQFFPSFPASISPVLLRTHDRRGFAPVFLWRAQQAHALRHDRRAGGADGAGHGADRRPGLTGPRRGQRHPEPFKAMQENIKEQQ